MRQITFSYLILAIELVHKMTAYYTILFYLCGRLFLSQCWSTYYLCQAGYIAEFFWTVCHFLYRVTQQTSTWRRIWALRVLNCVNLQQSQNSIACNLLMQHLKFLQIPFKQNVLLLFVFAIGNSAEFRNDQVAPSKKRLAGMKNGTHSSARPNLGF